MLTLQFLAHLEHSPTCLVNKKSCGLLLQKLPHSTTGDFTLWLWNRDKRSGTVESHFTAPYLESLPGTIL